MSELSADEALAVARTLTEAGVPVVGPLHAERIPGGRSNQTFILTDGASRWVLRTPPRTGRTPSAHDVGREYQVTSALASRGVPVPRPLLYHPGEELIGGPFTVAEFVSGVTVQRRDQLDALDDATVAAVTSQLLATLAELHALDHAAAGLRGFGRPDGYAERQLRRWSQQWELVGPAVLSPLATELITRLAAALPRQRAVAVVHGDFRIDNTIVDLSAPNPRIAAVVDWELSTIGDPVADVAMMCAYRAPSFDLVLGTPTAWTSPRLPDAPALAATYEAVGGAPLADWESHLALAYFKIAAIAAGIDHRHRAGATSGPGFDTAGQAAEEFLELGLATVRGHDLSKEPR